VAVNWPLSSYENVSVPSAFTVLVTRPAVSYAQA
jgi:hypothetical protein